MRSSTTWKPSAATASAPATPGWPRCTPCSGSPHCATPNTPRSIQRVLAIPPKRFDRRLVTYLTEPEIAALLAAPDTDTLTGRRDHALLVLAVQTGLRVSELTALTCADVHLGAGAHVNCLGKGRKQRITPLTSTTTAVIRAWLAERRGEPTDPLFPSRHGTVMSRDALERRLAKHAAIAARVEPTLAEKKISPHVLRHTAAMRLLAAGVDSTVIALWLGHESVATTQIYIHADLALKEQALARTAPHGRRSRPLPTLRHRHGLPRRPLIMPTTLSGTPPPAAAPGSTSA